MRDRSKQYDHAREWTNPMQYQVVESSKMTLRKATARNLPALSVRLHDHPCATREVASTVPETLPDAPPQEPAVEPQRVPDVPERKPDLDPFNPDWPEHRPEPQPKAGPCAMLSDERNCAAESC